MLAAALIAGTVRAQPNVQQHDGHSPAPYDPELAVVEGEVIAIDKGTRNITLKHGPIRSLAMPAMTMEFQVIDPAMLEKVRPGDRANFEADIMSGVLTVTRIGPAQPFNREPRK